MAILIVLILFSLLILLLGFLGIKIPFTARQAAISERISSWKHYAEIEEKLVKNSVNNTLFKTKFLRAKTEEAQF